MVLWWGLVPWWSTTTEKLWLLEIYTIMKQKGKTRFYDPIYPTVSGNANDFL